MPSVSKFSCTEHLKVYRNNIVFTLQITSKLPAASSFFLSDYGCVVVHIFSPEAREFYDLERLWSDAEEIDISGIVTQD